MTDSTPPPSTPPTEADLDLFARTYLVGRLSTVADAELGEPTYELRRWRTRLVRRREAIYQQARDLSIELQEIEGKLHRIHRMIEEKETP